MSSSHFSFHALLVIFLSAIQSISGACLAFVHAYKQVYSTIKLVNKTPPSAKSTSTMMSSPASHSSPPTPPPLKYTLSPPSTSANSSTSSLSLPPPLPSPRLRSGSALQSQPDYIRPLLEMFAEILTTRDRFASSTIMGTLSMLSASLTPFFDRYFFFPESSNID
jgi:hypothetical protein